MNQYEELFKIIQNQSIKHNSESLKVGVMKSKNTCELGTLILDEDDLYISEHLLNPTCTKVDIAIENGIIVDRSKYLEPLKEGDSVVLYRLNDEKYLLIEKVV